MPGGLETNATLIPAEGFDGTVFSQRPLEAGIARPCCSRSCVDQYQIASLQRLEFHQKDSLFSRGSIMLLGIQCNAMLSSQQKGSSHCHHSGEG
jgi:hypothetical protein